MIAPLATLAFLTAIWLLVVLGAAILEHSGARIASALKGQVPQPLARSVPVRVRGSARPQTAMRARARLRAAA
jgi:hypothetical protein